MTWEGENNVMYLQTARYLIKSALAVQAGKPLTGSAAYLATAAQQVRGQDGQGGKTRCSNAAGREAVLLLPQPTGPPKLATTHPPCLHPPARRAPSAAWPPPATGRAPLTCWRA